ncbi:MAG: DEAD/DEAH box helicase, partial [bacterium]
LDRPLSGVAELARNCNFSLPEIKTAVRTGDTSTSDRQAQIRRPPHVLITTPESLHLILGGRARTMLQGLKFVIVDELHALAGQKRGTFLAILLERLVHEIGREPVRIGLTATVNPVEEAAAFLGGFSAPADYPAHRKKTGTKHQELFQPRPVTIVRSIVPKSWDLKVSRAEADPDPNQPRTIWPSLEKEIHGLIDQHQSTLVFANNRYLVERLAAHINDLSAETTIAKDHSPIEPADLADHAGAETPSADDSPAALVHAHHGSISLERRRQTESMLKQGQLRGVISTASLEMGIDMGAVDLVCQVGSPGEVARGLQRVGRAGHAVGAVSKGRFFARTNADLLEMAALVEAMSRSAVEPLAIPQNCLDMLAQQVVACVAVRPWKPRHLFHLFRSSYPYQNLSEKAFEAVLEMLAGRFRVDAVRDLKARIFWDRLRDELIALPGTDSLALTGGGAIPDTGQYPVKLGDGGPTLGTLDEEFVLERR